jgi:hypothetical protein
VNITAQRRRGVNSLPSSGVCISVEPFETAVASSLFSIRVPRSVHWTCSFLQDGYCEGRCVSGTRGGEF